MDWAHWRDSAQRMEARRPTYGEAGLPALTQCKRPRGRAGPRVGPDPWHRDNLSDGAGHGWPPLGPGDQGAEAVGLGDPHRTDLSPLDHALLRFFADPRSRSQGGAAVGPHLIIFA